MLNSNSEIANKVSLIIDQKIQYQVLKGEKKYGKTLDECNLDDYDFLNMAMEETIDGMQYLVKEIVRLKAELSILKSKAWYQVYKENLELAQENQKLKQAYDGLLKSL